MKKFANGFARLVFGLCVVMTAPAWALGEAPKVEAAKEATPTAEKKADPKCEGITLTGEKFLDLFHAIAMRGDLTDVPFIEKTLETKFDVKYSDGVDARQHHYKRATYNSKIFFGAPMDISLAFNVEPEPLANTKSGAIMKIEGTIWRCLAISSAQIKQKFGGTPILFNGTIASTITMGNTLKGVGKNGSNIQVIYDYSNKSNDEIIYNPYMKQYWE